VHRRVRRPIIVPIPTELVVVKALSKRPPEVDPGVAGGQRAVDPLLEDAIRQPRRIQFDVDFNENPGVQISAASSAGILWRKRGIVPVMGRDLRAMAAWSTAPRSVISPRCEGPNFTIEDQDEAVSRLNQNPSGRRLYPALNHFSKILPKAAGRVF
jgi:hypothetical protein